MQAAGECKESIFSPKGGRRGSPSQCENIWEDSYQKGTSEGFCVCVACWMQPQCIAPRLNKKFKGSPDVPRAAEASH